MRTGRIVFLLFLGAAVGAALLPAVARTSRPQRASTSGATEVLPAPAVEVPRPAPGSDMTALAAEILRVAPDANPSTLTDALRAIACEHASGPPESRNGKDSILALIDYSLPSTERRLWVFDLAKRSLLYHDLVAHGIGSGDNQATSFSNDSGTKASSLGLYRAAEVYEGRNGYSMRLDGLTPGYNDHARERDIVMHGAWYVSPKHLSLFGRLGRSWGCPALDQKVAAPIIDTLRDGAWVYISAKNLERQKDEVVAAVCGDTK